jgi:molybdopterin-binding protein
VLLPLILPPVVTGYVLLLLFGRQGPLGRCAALACAIMGFPLMVRAIQLSIEAVDRRLEQAAGTLGANRAWVLLTVTLPLALPGIIAGAILCFARAMGEFGATITLASRSSMSAIRAEVARLATLVVLMSEGRVVAAGPTPELMSRIDLFPLTGRVEAGAVIDGAVLTHDAAAGLTTLSTRAGALRVPRLDILAGAAIRVRIRARDVIIAIKKPEGLSALNVLPGVVVEIGQSRGPIVEIALDCGGERLLARLTRHSIDTLGLAPGREVYAVVKSIPSTARAPGAPLRRGHQTMAGKALRYAKSQGITATPQGRRPTGTDFSGLRLATSIMVMSLVRPLAT